MPPFVRCHRRAAPHPPVLSPYVPGEETTESVLDHLARYHGPDVALASRDAFTRVLTERAEPDAMPVLSVVRRLPVLELVRHAQPDSSNSELRRLIAQGAVQLNGERLADPVEQVTVADGDVLRTGRRTWHRLRVG